ncbi:MAG: 3-deoxy-D-manno-octulosonic acid transferase [Clostridia bacterium]|nr:3-deoxy-D-manno-octulosonic acid transferase [Clostridia bacterium]
MAFFYSILIHLYILLIRLAALWNPKAKQWVAGRRRIFEDLKERISHDQPLAWFHCASLGEFEQGRPVIEAYRLQHPAHRILVTFFSPSGYEVRKNYTGADYIFYLPADTLSNARRFVALVKPQIVFFVKYEYWFNYLRQLHKAGVQVVGISSIFRPGQRFFRWYGRWQLAALKRFDHFFVQDQQSANLLAKAGVSQVTVSGDTRFDRVAEVARQKRPFPLVEQFARGHQVFIAGSTWPPDEAMVRLVIGQNNRGLKFIIAPHEVHEARIQRLVELLPRETVRFSQATDQNLAEARVLVIDNIGILSHLYQYADVAYIGGGFGVGIHNILEAATFGLPVLFGPNYHKFREAVELIAQGGAFSFASEQEFLAAVLPLLSDGPHRKATAHIARQYVEDRQGATRIILGRLPAG